MAEAYATPLSISPLGESALLVNFPNRISPVVNSQVHALARHLRDMDVPGVVDLVPAYASLLVSYDANQLASEVLVEEIVKAYPQARAQGEYNNQSSREHLVPVQYGGEAGPDLEEVAGLHGLSEDEVIRVHTSRDYRVHFLGFLPGFAYLGKLPGRLATPRLANPRTRVSAGSVGLAASQTAVYPFASPGGWRIIGRTSLPVWNPFGEKPALFTPGDTVRFIRSTHEPEPQLQTTDISGLPALPAFEVLSAGGITTVQDLGRPGLAHIGLARGGVCDAPSAMITNSLVGNALEAALLEMAWQGPTLRALNNLTVALAGADLGCTVDGAPVPSGLSWFVRRGSILRFTGAQSSRGGMRGYLAIAGGIDVPVVLGACSTSLLARFGGYNGRALQAGDMIGTCTNVADSAFLAGRFWPGQTQYLTTATPAIRYVPFRGPGRAPSIAQRDFQERHFELTEQADRMGYRFRGAHGENLSSARSELISFGVIRGAIQLPPSGNPVVLNVEHQTTGGYPLLGVVAKADFHLLAQIQPGSRVRFAAITSEEARRALTSSIAALSNQFRATGHELSDQLAVGS